MNNITLTYNNQNPDGSGDNDKDAPLNARVNYEQFVDCTIDLLMDATQDDLSHLGKVDLPLVINTTNLDAMLGLFVRGVTLSYVDVSVKLQVKYV